MTTSSGEGIAPGCGGRRAAGGGAPLAASRWTTAQHTAAVPSIPPSTVLSVLSRFSVPLSREANLPQSFPEQALRREARVPRPSLSTPARPRESRGEGAGPSGSLVSRRSARLAATMDSARPGGFPTNPAARTGERRFVDFVSFPVHLAGGAASSMLSCCAQQAGV